MPRTRRRDAAAPPPPAGSTLAGARRIRENLPRPAPVAASSGTATSPGQRPAAPPRRRNPFSALGRLQPRFAADIIAELRKVTWPSFEETRYLTVVVAIVALAVGILLGGVDLVFGWVIEQLFF